MAPVAKAEGPVASTDIQKRPAPMRRVNLQPPNPPTQEGSTNEAPCFYFCPQRFSEDGFHQPQSVIDIEALAAVMDEEALACAVDMLQHAPDASVKEFCSLLMREFWELNFDTTGPGLHRSINSAKANATQWGKQA